MNPASAPDAIAALAAIVRDRLGQLTEALRTSADRSVPEGSGTDLAQRAARQFATVVVAAAAPFAVTAPSRARLVRQMHAAGLLSDVESRIARSALEVGAADAPGR